MRHISFAAESTRELLDTMPDGVLAVDEGGVILYANARMETLFGYRRDQLIGEPVELLLPLGVRTAHRRHRTSFLAAGGTRAMGAGLDLRGRRRDGTLFPVDIQLTVGDSLDGRVAIAAVRDLTERTAAMTALRQKEERYRQVVENASEVFYRVALTPHPSGSRIEFVSQQCQNLIGRRPEEFLADPELWLESVHPDDRPVLAEATRTILAQRGPGTRIYRLRHADSGRYRWIEDRIIPDIDSTGEVIGFHGVARDITERVEAEEGHRRLELQLRQAQKMEAVGRLAGGVAHDFNNILTVILGNCENALALLDPGSPALEDLTEVVEAARRAAGLTQQLLAFGRRQSIAPRALDLTRQLRGVERMLRRTIGADIDLVLEVADQLWPVWLDPSQLDQLIINLAVNARDAMPDGGALTIATDMSTLDQDYCSTHAGFRAGDYVTLTVSDTGCGIDAATLEHVFEPFFTTKPEGKGTGLGLATIYGIVKQNDGFVNIYSEPGHGTTVRVYLPRYVGGDPIATPEPPRPPAGGSETVLLVEDNDQVRRLTHRLLTRLGYTVLEAASPDVALALCQAYGREIQLLLTDLVMPTMNGARLAEAVTGLRPGIRVLFMSGYPASITARRDLVPGRTPQIQKPFDLDTLARKVRDALEG